MKLFIDSSQESFVAIIFDQNNKSIYKSQINTKYKVEEIIHFFDEVPYLNQIQDIYINLGPGSFTGSRIALLYIRTLAQIKNEIKIHTISTYDILNFQLNNHWFSKKKIYIKATKQKSYYLTKESTKIINKAKKEYQIDYEQIINKFDKYLSLFKETKLIDLKPIYASEPQIGELVK